MPTARRHASVAQERHKARLVQQVPPGTPGAVVDPITGRSFLARWLAVGSEPGWSQADLALTLGDASELVLTVPPTGPDGKQASERFYCLADTPDPEGDGTVAYFPGDEWIEMYRDPQELIASGTPISLAGQLDQVQLTCRDVLQPLKKTKEKSGGFWCNSPRDVFEHYLRVWLGVISDDFATSPSQFPAWAGADNTGSTPDGEWGYVNASGDAGASLVRLHPTVGSSIAAVGSTRSWPDDGSFGHGCWRAETRFAAANLNRDGATLVYLLAGDAQLSVDMAGNAHATSDVSGSTLSWPILTTGSQTALMPLTLAIEARDRWYLYYVNGQLVSVGARQPGASCQVTAGTDSSTYDPTHYLPTGFVDVDYIVVRRTSRPYNGGQPGDYHLPSVPAAGGLSGEYFDLEPSYAQNPGGGGAIAVNELLGAPQSAGKVGERVDAFPLPTGTDPGWQLTSQGGRFYVRWTGAVYLPLDVQDVHFTLPAGDTGSLTLWVGRTRRGEEILRPGLSPSVGMRALFGEQPGWYPLVILYQVSDTTLTSNPNVQWDVGGSVVPIPNGMLAPLGVYRDQVPAGDSHYDTLRQIATDFAYQFKSTPASLESGHFPGYVIPRGRVGRDTNFKLTIDEALDPQLSVNFEDVAAALQAAAQGLGGNSTGTLTLEAFDFDTLLKHPFVSHESENLPTSSVLAQLVSTLLSLLGYRSSGWEDVQATVPGTREKVDTFPLTGDLEEFDWQPGDALLVQAPEIFVEDVIPRQIFSLKRTITPDGNAQTQASFRPRDRNIQTTLRKFVRQVYGDRRTFQGQFVSQPPARAVAPAYSEATLPDDLSQVRRCDLVVLTKDDDTTPFTVEINGTTLAWQVTRPGRYGLMGVLAANGTEPRIVCRLINAGADDCGCSYQLDVVTLIPAF